MPSLIRSMPRYPSFGSPMEVPNELAAHLLESTLSKPSKRRFSHHRTSYEHPQSNKSSSENLVSKEDAFLQFQIESPPLVCFGSPEDSEGALLAGMLWLCVGHNSIDIDSLSLSIQCITGTRKPVTPGCPDCLVQRTTLAIFKLIHGAQVSRSGEHNYPFSYLFDGKTPATITSTLGFIKYELVASGHLVNGEKLKLTREIVISRSILPGPDKNSLRIFPPTDLTANVTLPSVIHKGAPFNIEMTLEGLNNTNKTSRWRLRKMVWRIDENTKIISQACKAHAAKIGGEGKGVLHEDVRTLACTEIKRGWKTDFSNNGKVELEFTSGIPAGTIACNNVEQKNGITVLHNLVVEMIVAEEFTPKNTKLATPTGAARVLRMQFKLNVTDHSGLGVSWADECPPLYTDIPQSPPTYNVAVDNLPSYMTSMSLCDSMTTPPPLSPSSSVSSL